MMTPIGATRRNRWSSCETSKSESWLGLSPIALRYAIQVLCRRGEVLMNPWLLGLLAQLLLSRTWRIMAPTHGRACVGVFTAQEFHFADFTLDQAHYRLQRGERPCVWKNSPWSCSFCWSNGAESWCPATRLRSACGEEVFLDVDHSINTAIRKVRLALSGRSREASFRRNCCRQGLPLCGPSDLAEWGLDPQTQTAPTPAHGESSPDGSTVQS